ncbi:MAG: polysaccharide deacetylase family protein [Acidimicrobiia bacterium]|nr:polysaccharide deacetylase family protein [Acidimicrobiia bacterium]
MNKPLASLSLDLDNAWSYLQIHGNEEWQSYPSYLDQLVPMFLDDMAARNLKVTVFVVGKDASLPQNRDLLRGIAESGHEIGNHSFNHLPWLDRFTAAGLRAELTEAHDAIGTATGSSTVGFRGPGFSFSAETLSVLASLGYTYDASTLPTFIGPLARAYYFRSGDLSEEERELRSKLFGSFKDIRLPNTAYRWATHDLMELPVTTIPLIRTPFHLSYLLWLAGISEKLADLYLSVALAACRATGTTPSVLIHPLDFFGGDDAPDLAFFPGMEHSGAEKRAISGHFLDRLTDAFDFTTCRAHVEASKPSRTVTL